MNKIIFASSSLSRKKIIRQVGIKCLFKKPLINEEKCKMQITRKKITTKKITKILARLKSQSVSKHHKDSVVISCDTMIELDGKKIDKAKNFKEAQTKLKQLSGRKHEIYSSISITVNNKEIWTHTEKSNVTIKKLSDKEIVEYLKKNGKKILQSVGCYQAERMGPLVFSKLEGDFYNILGLPIISLIQYLRKNKLLKI